MTDRDDSFWALLSQLFLQLLSLYCTTVPLIRNRQLPVRRFWFCLSIVISATMSIISPVVYGVSRKPSALATYISGVASLIASAQLIGGIQQTEIGLDIVEG